MTRPDLGNSLDWVAALISVVALLAVLQTFAIGRHYIIPTAILVPTVLFGNLARFGLSGRRWAKEILFWIGVIFTAHTFFALFFAKTPRELLGAAFEPVCALVFVASLFAVVQYARRNRLFADDAS
ncbi:MAG TPA: hypothetical protein VLA56_14915 [Pseudomonadales bacterium]|nr:hypothetical protein [Pseudomonadales bacterium]